MITSYKSLYPNHAHQLSFSVSKHYYAGKDGLLKYQIKPMEVTPAKLAASSRRHMLVYCLRDHCSGVFYAEIAFRPDLPSMHEFLSRAWSPKSDYPFHGVPALLMVPSTVEQVFPGLSRSVSQLGVGLVQVTSGFQSGIGDIKNIERGLSMSSGWSVEKAQQWVRKICRDHAQTKARTNDQSKLDMWLKGVPAVQILPAQWGVAHEN